MKCRIFKIDNIDLLEVVSLRGELKRPDLLSREIVSGDDLTGLLMNPGPCGCQDSSCYNFFYYIHVLLLTQPEGLRVQSHYLPGSTTLKASEACLSFIETLQ